MRTNTVLIVAGILVLLAAQLFIFRFEKLNDYLFRNRYTGKVYTVADLMASSTNIPESDTVELLRKEINDLKNDRTQIIEQITIRDEEIKLLNEVSRRYFSEERKEIEKLSKRLCYMVGCYAQIGGFANSRSPCINMDDRFYSPDQVFTGILQCRNKLEDLLKKENR